nr:U32 family peptidase [Lachnospiraceae bacterium]
KPFYEAGLDGVIVQDLGVISLLLDEFKDMEVHASTQMSVSSVYGAKLLRDLGVKRVVTSRELSVKEIKDIYDITGLDLECFIHGAMCYSYSGMCLMSSMLGGRSGNRGRCAGPCRQPYSMEDRKKRNASGKYLLSMKDLCTIDILDELIIAGIASFKIEGRMKSPEYVYGVTDIYRRNIDSILSRPDPDYRPDEKDRQRLIDLYSRGGISEGYYHRRNGLSMITIEKGSYKREDTEKLDMDHRKLPLKAYLEVYTGCDMSLTAEYEIRDGSPANDAQSITEDINPDKGHMAPNNNGDYVKQQEPSGDNISVTVSGDVAEAADKRPMTEEDLKKQLLKTGESDFYFDEININTDGKSFVRVSSINALRRKVIEEIRSRLINGHKRSL